MKVDDELRQKLWELVYGLLDEEETQRLNATVSTDGDVARAYAEMKLQSEMLADAAKKDSAALPIKDLIRAAKVTKPQPAESTATQGDSRAARSSNSQFVNWLISLAAILLVCFTAYSYWNPETNVHPDEYQQSQNDLADEYVRVVVTGPSELATDTSNQFTVSTASLTGAATSNDVEYRLYDHRDQLSLRSNGRTDDAGLMTIDIPGDLAAMNTRLVVETKGVANDDTFETFFTTRKREYSTYLTTDKPLYRPGETVFFRSLTLSRFANDADRDTVVQFEIHNPAGTVVPQSKQMGVTQHGVGNGVFAIPPQFSGGQYTLIARSPQNAFPEQQRAFNIRDYRVPRLKKEIEFTRDSYGPGDEVIADFSAERAEGGAAANVPLQIRVVVDGEEVLARKATSSDAGTHQVTFNLPETIERGSGLLSIVVEDGTQETEAKTIPINLGKVDVTFYPEGGDLVSGLESRVYFRAIDPLGKPVHIEGRVLDGDESEVAVVETTHDGFGVFSYVPAHGETYRLKIDKPTGVEEKSDLPKVIDERFLVMQSTQHVVEPNESVDLKLTTNREAPPLVVQATCRGVDVGRTSLVPEDFESAKKDVRECHVSVPLSGEAAGTIRVTVLDFGQSPPNPIAERLVYRRPERKLNVRLAGHAEAYSPGDNVNAQLITLDENNKPTAAVLGVAIVDDALLNLADDKSPRMKTHYWLTSEIEKPEDLEDANFYLDKGEEAETALDLLLGTQGWRKFVEASADQIIAAAEAETEKSGEQSPTEKELATASVGLPLVYDNVDEVVEQHSEAAAALAATRLSNLHEIGHLLTFFSLGLLAAAVLAVLFRIIDPARVALPVTIGAVVCSVIGFEWAGAEFNQSSGVSLASFQPFGIQDESAKSGEDVNVTQLVQAWNKAFGNGHDMKKLQPMFQRFAIEYDDLALNSFYLFKQREDFGDLAQRDWKQWEGRNPWDIVLLQDLQAGSRIEAGFITGAEGGGMGGGGFGLNMPFGLYEQRLNANGILESKPAALGAMLIPPFFPAADAGENGEADGWSYKALEDLERRGSKLSTDEKATFVNWARAMQEALKNFRFPVRQYAHQHQAGNDPKVRSDFTETLYWNPLLITDESGMASIEFELSDSVTTFRVSTDAHGVGRIGSGQDEIISRIPFSIEPKIPLEVNAGDRIDLPVAINNDSKDDLPVSVSLTHNEMFTLSGDASRQLDLTSGERTREHFSLNVVGHRGVANVEVKGIAGRLNDAIQRKIKVVPAGFPVSQSLAGRIDGDQTVSLILPESWVPGSLQVSLKAFPSSLADLEKGVEGILREPSGCFEQTSSSNYPNIMALQFMQEHDVADPGFTRRAKDLLKKGYGRLISYECSKKGYEWFGGDPGHEALTAYGLMEFRDMSDVWDVDQEMVTRTAKWLLERRDGKGGFKRNSRALDSFGRAPKPITDAYIVWGVERSRSDGHRSRIDDLDQCRER